MDDFEQVAGELADKLQRLETAYPDPLEPFIGRHVKVRCGKCRRVLDVLTPNSWQGKVIRSSADAFGYSGLVSRGQTDGAMFDRGRAGAKKKGRPFIRWESAAELNEDGQPGYWTDGRKAGFCDPRCGARFTVTESYLEARFVRAVRAGAGEFVL